MSRSGTAAILGSGLALAIGIIGTAGAGSAATGVHRSQGTTLAQVKQQQAAESGRSVTNGKPLHQPVTQTNLMKSMPGMANMAATAATVVSGPTNLASNVGGSWNNYAFTIPNDPSCPAGVGTQQATDDGTTAKLCPDGANGASGAVHAVQLYDGKVLIMAGSGNQWMNLQAGDWTSWLWDPTQADQSKAWKFIKTPYDMFCAGHVELANGNILIAGGTTQYPQYDANGNLVHDWDGSKQAYIFNVQTEQYQAISSMNGARWYPTLVTTGDGKVVAVGGLDDQAQNLGLVTHNNDVPELYDPSSNTWQKLPSMDFTASDPSTQTAASSTTRTFPYFPGMVLAANGQLWYSGESNGDNGIVSGFWDYLHGTFSSTGATPGVNPYDRNAGATVMLPPAQNQKVMVMGGGDYSMASNNDTEIFDLNARTWSKGPAMSAAKMYVGAVVLPDYTVMETDGAANFRQDGVHTAEDYNPTTNAFTVWNSPSLDRLYHSNAFLEPNGQVAVMGSQPLDASFEMHISIYSPPYLFKGARPTVTGTQAFDYSGTAQGSFQVTTAPGTTLAKASLIRPSATTHSTDPDQRLVDLAITHNADGSYSFTPPTNSNVAPAGQYMLFVTDSTGVPSVADWVSIGAPLAGGGGSTPTPAPTPSSAPTTAPTTAPAPTTTPTPAPTTTVTTPGIVLTATATGWVGTFTATSSAPGDLYLQSLVNGVWTNDTNQPTVASGSNNISKFTWGGGSPTQFRVVLPGSTLVSNIITVTYAAGATGPFGPASPTTSPTPTPTSSGSSRTLSLTATESKYEGQFTIQSSVKAGGQTLDLQQYTNGVWTTVLGWGCNGTGSVSMTYGGPGGTFQFRATSPTTASAPAATSATISVTYP